MLQRKFSTLLTMLSVAIGVALVVSIHVLKQASLNGFTLSQTGIDLVVGPKGDPLSLVLQGVYHKGQPQAKLPLWFYYELQEHPAVKYVIPISLGDSYRGHRVAGTSTEIFSKFEYIEGRRFRFARGEPFTKDLEGVIGATVAAEQKLKIGDSVQYACGLYEETADSQPEHTHELKVVGILEPTYTPCDQVIYVSYQTYIHLHEHIEDEADDHDASHGEAAHTHEAEAPKETPHEHAATPGSKAAGHDHEAHAHEHDGHACPHQHGMALPASRKLDVKRPADGGFVSIAGGKQDIMATSLLLVKAKGALGAVQLHTRVNEGHVATAAIPSREIMNLFAIIGGVTLALHAISALVVVVAAIGIMVAIYNSMNERTHAIAVMRALGASRDTIESLILTESALICIIGGVVGLILGYAVVFAAAPLVTRYTNTNILLQWSDLRQPISQALRIPLYVAYGLGMLVLALLGMLVGMLPAKKAYKVDVAGNLTGTR